MKASANGDNGVSASAQADKIAELTAAIAQFAGAKKKLEDLTARIGALKSEREEALQKAKALAARIKALLDLHGPRAAKKGPPRVKRGARGEIALRLLLSDGGPYSTQTFAEEFGSPSVGAAYQVMRKLEQGGLVRRPRDGHGELTDAGRKAAQELAN